MLGRQVLRLPLRLRLASLQCQQPHDLSSRAALLIAQRAYATEADTTTPTPAKRPGRPRKAVGEPSKPIKRAVKRAAKAPAASTTVTTEDGDADADPATRLVKERKKRAAVKKPAKKAAAKQTPAKKTPAKKGRPALRALTDEQKAAAAAKLDKAKISDLKKAALSPPTIRPANAYNVFLQERTKGRKREGQNMADFTAPVRQEWKDTSPADLEHYNHLAHTVREAAQAEYKHWVESHTVEQIHLANRARTTLRRKLLELKHTTKYSPIHDERAVKRPLMAYLQFSVNRQASGDFKHITMPERAKLIGQEWKALSENEKKKYKDLQAEESSRYASEYNTMFGQMPPYAQVQPQAAAAVSA